MKKLLAKKAKRPRPRRCLPTIAELIDEMTISQIKRTMQPAAASSHRRRMAALKHDIDILVEAKNLRLSARLLHIITVLAQVNLQIWLLKDRMTEEPAAYDEHLKRAHQLNGLRNQMRNLILTEAGELDGATRRSNDDAEGLPGGAIDDD